MQEYSVLGGKCPGESKKKIRRILSLVENVQENRKKNREEIVLGGKYPGGSKIYLGGICD